MTILPLEILTTCLGFHLARMVVKSYCTLLLKGKSHDRYFGEPLEVYTTVFFLPQKFVLISPPPPPKTSHEMWRGERWKSLWSVFQPRFASEVSSRPLVGPALCSFCGVDRTSWSRMLVVIDQTINIYNVGATKPDVMRDWDLEQIRGIPEEILSQVT